MKKILFIILSLALGSGLFGQRPPFHIGYMGTTTRPAGDIHVPAAGGTVAASQWNPGLQGSVMVGWNPGIIYLKKTFSDKLFVSKGYFGGYTELSWNVTNNVSDITGFYIYRKKYLAAGDSVLVAALANNARSWQDHYCEAGQIYEYTLYVQGITDDFALEYINYIDGFGFRVPTATVSGRVTYQGGVAVDGVKILAESDDKFSSWSVYLGGDNSYLSIPDNPNTNLFDLDTAFTFSSWIQPLDATDGAVIFSKGEQYKIGYEKDKINFWVQGQLLSIDYTNKADTFFHVSASWSKKTKLASLYLMYSDEEVVKKQAVVDASPVKNPEPVFIGRDATGNFFKGYVHDIRLYRTALSEAVILNSFGRFLSGTEAGMVAYLQLNEGAGNLIFDRSRSGFTFYENHGSITGGQWHELFPASAQLSHKGVTNHSGNYFITGIPYHTDGSVYSITPLYQNHQFEPNHALLFMSSSSATHNNINFVDISSFQVSGNIRYKNTHFPLEGATFRIDGNTVVDINGSPVTSDADGNYTLRVPIGNHSISVEKQGHVFSGGGRFPQQPNTTHDFQQPVSSLNFIDETLIKVTGRVAGGPIEAARATGLGQTHNNLGPAVITLTPQKEKSLTDSGNDVAGMWQQIIWKGGAEENVGNTSFLIDADSPRFIKIYPDEQTGEFVAWLLPERYVITGARAGSYTFDNSFHTVIDLTNKFGLVTESDTMTTKVVKGGEVVDVKRIDSVQFQYKHDFIYRVSPSVTVQRPDGDPVFWEREVEARDGKKVKLVNADGTLNTLYPVLKQRGVYDLKISVFEQYVNPFLSDSIDMVPVTDGVVEIQNQLAINQELQTFPIDENGLVHYTFTGGLPNIATGGIGSYLLTMAVVARTGDNQAINTPWLYNEKTFRAYLFGGMPTGNNFVTSGPNEVVTILRDPAGSQSFASLQKGQEIINTTQHSFERKIESSVNVNVDLGTKVITFAGLGAGVITETEDVASVDIGLEASVAFKNNSTTTSTTIATQEWQTSGEADFVGSNGDVYVGYATNIVYGISTQIDIMPVGMLAGDGWVNNAFDYEGVSYDIGMTKGIRVNPEIETTFMYTQSHIENALLPNLRKLRNSFLLANAQYKCVICDKESDEFGRPNLTGSETTEGYSGGDSYNIILPSGWPQDSLFVDSVDYYNNQIADWISHLEYNEKEKLNAVLQQNISFDGGTTYSSSLTTQNSTEKIRTFEWSVAPKVGGEVGFEIMGMGTKWTYEQKTSFTTTDETGSTHTNSTTYSYTLSDGNAGDYISLDVKQPLSPYGPVFSVVGGQTMCPYEDGEYSKYYQPGKLIHQATMRREVPVITCENPIMINVPEDSPAIFNVQLANLSETGDDQWFKLIIDEVSNQNGALIMMDGSPIGNGRIVMVPAGMTINKTISVNKVKPDFYDYQNLTMILQSSCEENIADSIAISAYFQPVCSAIRLNQPADQWVVNTITGTEMNIHFDSYNLNHSTFRKVLFQYKPTSSSLWFTAMTFYVNESDFNEASEPKTFIGGQPGVNYTWDMSNLIDRRYDVRVTSICTDGTVNHSQIKKGIKDTRRPQVFGTPQPGNGFLSPGDNVMVAFNEPIVGQMLTPYNFSVRGVLNGYVLDHNTSLFFDGVSSYANVRNGVNITENSFTIEFWLNRYKAGKAVVLSQSHDMEAGFTETDKFYLRLGTQEIITVDAFAQLNSWSHWGIVYNAVTSMVSFYKDDVRVLENVKVTEPFEAVGNLYIGKSFFNTGFLNGAIHELRVWNKPLSMSVFYQNAMKSLNGGEMNLVGYWPMNEANGAKATDHSRSQHANLYNTTWQVLPLKYSRYFDGQDDLLLINTASSVMILPEMDFTIELWFKGQAQTNTTLFSNGIGDGTDTNPGVRNALSIGFDESGRLQVQNNGSAVTAEGNFLDNQWHHVAVVMNRQTNLSLYVDGQVQAYLQSSIFSGMAGAQMTLGARRYMAGSEWIVDNHFAGYIDEVRIWNLSRRRNQLEMERNSKLIGDEMGLAAYYPFEQYREEMGIMLLKPTLEDQYIPPYEGWSNGGEAEPHQGDFSMETPTIRDARPVENVQFSWVASEDKIIVNVEETPEAIEKVVLEFTVSGVEDVNENRLASPVTWTAFVKQNTVLWDQERMTFEKELYAPLTFQVKIVNVGGIDQNYAISNLPVWLKCSHPSGNLPPDSEKIIEFTVNDALNIGNYAVSLYLTGDFGYNEKMDLYLKVFKKAPEWTVNPSSFRFSSNITGQLYIDSLLSINEDNIVAAFKDGQCRGVGKVKYVEAYDTYMVFLDVYSNQEYGENIQLRVWDAARGQVITKVAPEINFSANTIMGSPSHPLPIYASSYYEGQIPLNEGWTWISFNLNSPYLNNLPVLFKDVTKRDYNLIKGQVSFDQYAQQSQSWFGNLSSTHGISTQQMYMVKTDQSDTLLYEGPVADVNIPVVMKKGWNWIGYLPQVAMDVNEALAYFHPQKNDLIKNQFQFSVYDVNFGWIGSLTMMQPGRGYMYHAGAEGELVYPASGIMSTKVSGGISPERGSAPWVYTPGSNAGTMNILARIWNDDTPDDTPYVLAAFVGNECRGMTTATPVNNEMLYFLSVDGSDAETIRFMIYHPDTHKIFPLNELVSYENDKLKGLSGEPVRLSRGEAGLTVGFNTFPNPFSDKLFLQFNNELDNNTSVTITDVAGRVVFSFDANSITGQTQLEWNGRSSSGQKIEPGVYMVTVRNKDGLRSVSIINY